MVISAIHGKAMAAKCGIARLDPARSDFPPGEFSIVSPKPRAVVLGAWHGIVPVP